MENSTSSIEGGVLKRSLAMAVTVGILQGYTKMGGVRCPICRKGYNILHLTGDEYPDEVPRQKASLKDILSMGHRADCYRGHFVSLELRFRRKYDFKENRAL